MPDSGGWSLMRSESLIHSVCVVQDKPNLPLILSTDFVIITKKTVTKSPAIRMTGKFPVLMSYYMARFHRKGVYYKHAKFPNLFNQDKYPTWLIRNLKQLCYDADWSTKILYCLADIQNRIVIEMSKYLR